MSDPLLFLILTAALIDAVLGDPAYPAHPIRLLGAWSLFWERQLFAIGWSGYLGGALHWLFVVGGALVIWWGIRTAFQVLDPWAAWAWDVFLAYSLLCMRDLLVHGKRVSDNLVNLPAARRQTAMLVGRDTRNLPRAGIVRATIESLAENLTDGVLTPLWALAIFGLPGLIVVKAVSSLDSMVGYKNARYRRFGRIAAHLDDLVNWLPARLSVPLVTLAAALSGLYPRTAWQAARTYHAMLPSPNSGWSEAAFAGALRVRLLGPIRYDGKLVNTRFMGDADWPSDLDDEDLHRALRLSVICHALGLGASIGLCLLRDVPSGFIF